MLSPHQASLKVHPDRVGEEDREVCTSKFQCVGAVYAVLSDETRRGLYDESGEVRNTEFLGSLSYFSPKLKTTSGFLLTDLTIDIDLSSLKY